MRRETPRRRVNPGGKVVFQARWTARDGKRRYGYPPDIKGTFEKRGPCKQRGTFDCCAQHAIDECYRRDEVAPTNPNTVGGYFLTWTRNHPRRQVTNDTNEGRIRAVLGVVIEGVPLGDWPFEDLRRRHASALVAAMLVDQGRSANGARGVLSSLSTMTEDAIDDEVAIGNAFRGVKVRQGDPRVQKQPKAKRVLPWERMHEFAADAAVTDAPHPGQPGPPPDVLAAHKRVYAEPMVRVLSDCGLRIGELLALHRADLDLEAGVLHVRRTLTAYGVEEGTKADKLKGLSAGMDGFGREVPVPPGLAGMLARMPKRIDTPLLFPAALGGVWIYQGFLNQVWRPAQRRLGEVATPHDFRHSFISHMRAAGVNDDDLAQITGHTVLTMLSTYSHPLGRSFDQVRSAVGE